MNSVYELKNQLSQQTWWITLFQAFKSWGPRKEIWAGKKNRTLGGLGCQSLLSPYLSLSPSQVFFLPLFFSALWLRAAPNYLNARNRLMTNMFATHFYPFFFNSSLDLNNKILHFHYKKKNKTLAVVIVITLRYHREDGILHSFTSFT